jgi:hypothetical protein
MKINEHEEKFLHFYLDQTAQEMRHLENLREKVTILVITLVSAIAGFIIQQKFSDQARPLVWFIIVLGVFGFAMTMKLYQLHQMAQKRLDKWYQYYESFCGIAPQILTLRDMADKENRADFKLYAQIKHSYFWATIHVFIIVAGAYLFVSYPVTPLSQPTQKEHHTTAVKDSVSKVIGIPDSELSKKLKTYTHSTDKHK